MDDSTERPASIAFVGATLIDGTGSAPRPDSAVVVTGGRIRWVGTAPELDRSAEIPAETRRVDVAGEYLIPGLLDANVHLVLHLDPDVLLRYEPGGYDDLVLESAQVALRAGITTVFDTWGPLESLRRVRDRIGTGQAVGSRIFCAGNIIGNGGPWSADFFPYGERLNPDLAAALNRHWEQGVGADLTWMSADQVRERVRDYIATSGIDFVKYASSAHAHYRFLALSPDAQRAIVEEAHAAGLTAQACALTPEALKVSLDAGVDLVQHANSTGRYPMPDDVLEPIVARRLPCTVLAYTRRRVAETQAGTRLPAHAREITSVKASNARRLLEAGADLLLATDGGTFGPTAQASPWLGPIFDLPDVPIELGRSHILWHQAMAGLGMAPMAALLATTRNIARAYGKDDELGTVEPGKRADLLILSADPLDDPANYGRVTHVVKDGQVVDRDRLPARPVLTTG